MQCEWAIFPVSETMKSYVRDVDDLIDKMTRLLELSVSREEADDLYDILVKSRHLSSRQISNIWNDGTRNAQWGDD